MESSWSEPLDLITLNLLALPVPGTKIVRALNYGESLWGKTAKIVTQLPSGETKNYFLKVGDFSLSSVTTNNLPGRKSWRDRAAHE